MRSGRIARFEVVLERPQGLGDAQTQDEFCCAGEEVEEVRA